MTTTPLALRVVGDAWDARRITNHRAALAAYARCDPLADLSRQSFLSHFSFPVAFREHFATPDASIEKAAGSEKGYVGECGADWLFWDIDRGDATEALADASRLVATILATFSEYQAADLLIFLSGGKGFHIGLPLVWRPEPSVDFNAVAKRFCLAVADKAGVVVDQAVYSKTRLFRAPNSRHAKTGRFKRWLPPGEFSRLSVADIFDMAAEPAPFEVPAGPPESPTAEAAWEAAKVATDDHAEARRRFVDDAGGPRLQAATIGVIRGAVDVGERHERLWRAAANLAEFGCPDDLAHALLYEAGLDMGLRPSDVTRQINCGLAKGLAGGARKN